MAATNDPTKTPALPPPDGIASNLENPYNSLRAIWIISLTICLFFPSILVPLRLYIKTLVMKSLHVADCEFLAFILQTPK